MEKIEMISGIVYEVDVDSIRVYRRLSSGTGMIHLSDIYPETTNINVRREVIKAIANDLKASAL